jgi:hypothetical protein
MTFLPGADRDPAQPRFHMEAVVDEAASAREGRPIYRQEERVQILLPGSPNQPVFRVDDSHRQRWPEQYAAFKRGEEMAIEGTPLEEWPILKKAQVFELKAQNIFTVEQCASLSDHALQKLGLTGHRLKERAIAFLDEAASQALNERLNYENDKMRAEIEALKRQNAEQGALLSQVHAQLQALQNAPHPVAVHVPGSVDPVELAKVRGFEEPAAPSALEALPPPRRRGRPPLNREALNG